MSDAPAVVPLLRARALQKSYAVGKRTLEVLRGIDLEVARGEFLALRGASGAGKSTLLHLLGGLDLPNAGDITFDGTNLRALSPGALAHWRNRRVGFIFQAYHLLPELSAWRASPRLRRPGARRRCWNGWVWGSGWSTGLMNCPAASSSAWPSRGRW
jgi:ABC-type phosphate/phosphonate transport system ATPase subunit